MTITGERLRGGSERVARVTLVGTAAQEVVFENDTVVVVRAGVPADPFVSRTGRVVVFGESGATITALGAFTYNVAGDVTGVSPSFGRSGTRVRLAGTNLLGAGTSASVAFDGLPAQVVSATETAIDVVVPARGSAGLVNVSIVSDSGSSVVEASGFRYTGPGLLSAVEPSSGHGGTVVTLRGTDLLAEEASVFALTLMLAHAAGNRVGAGAERFFQRVRSVHVGCERSIIHHECGGCFIA